jgi:ribosomal protein S12 methylthiotransferase
VDQYFGTTELPALLKALGADYKHELLGERLTTTPKITPIKIAEGCDRPCSFVLFNHARKTYRKLLKN